MQVEARSFSLREILFFLFLVLALQLSVANFYGMSADIFLDTDAYSWLNRVILLHENGNWFDARIPWINPPEGHLQHWTRPFDILLYSGATILAPIVGFEHGLSIWGQWISTVLHGISLVAMVWAFAPLAKRSGYEYLPVLACMFLAQINITWTFAFGRADHQSLLCLLFIVALGQALRMLVEPFDRNRAVLTGCISALAVWVSMESILGVLIVQTSLGIWWLLYGGQQYLKNLVCYNAALALASVLTLLTQSGLSGFLIPWSDQISIVYVVLFCLIWSWLLIARLISKNTFVSRLIFSGVGVIATSILIITLFPEMLDGPLNKVDDTYRTVRLENIQEIQPLLKLTWLQNGEWRLVLSSFVPNLGIALPAIFVMIFGLSRGVTGSAESQRQARLWTVLAVASAIFVPLAFYQVRWAYYANIATLPAYAWFAVKIMTCLQQRFSGTIGITLKIVALVALMIGPFFSFALAPPTNTETQTTNTSIRVSQLIKMSEFLNNPKGIGKETKNLLTYTDLGPELIYRTRHSVYSIPNHRPQPGFKTTLNIFGAVDDEAAKKRALEAAVDLIMVMPNSKERDYYRQAVAPEIVDPEILYDRLLAGTPPSWMIEIELPENLMDNFRLYEVKHSEAQ